MRGEMGSGPELPGSIAEPSRVVMRGLIDGRMRARGSHPLYSSSERNLLLSGLQGHERHGLLGLLSEHRSSRRSEGGRHSVIGDIRLALAPVGGLPIRRFPGNAGPSRRGEFLPRLPNGIPRGVALPWAVRRLRARFWLGGFPLGPGQRIQHVLQFAARLAERHLVISGFGRPRHRGHGALSILLSARRGQVGRHGRIRYVRFRATPERVACRVRPRGDHRVQPLCDIRVRLSEVVISACGSGHVHITNPFGHIVSLLAEVGIRSVDEFGILRVRRGRKVAE